MRIILKLEYDGTCFCGWQNQNNGKSVQEALEKAFFETTAEKVNIVASGRTDSGVHALGQIVHLDTTTNIPVDKLPYALNTHLPQGVSVLDAEAVPDTFHARYSAKRKTYMYKIYISPHISPLKRNTHYHINYQINIEEMKKAAQFLIGEHDFKCFQAVGNDELKSTIRTIYSLLIEEKGNEIYISVTGNGFLYNMVRIIVGTLLYVGQGKLKAIDMQSLIENRDRTKAGPTAPPQGLYLVNVEYE